MHDDAAITSFSAARYMPRAAETCHVYALSHFAAALLRYDMRAQRYYATRLRHDAAAMPYRTISRRVTCYHAYVD